MANQSNSRSHSVGQNTQKITEAMRWWRPGCVALNNSNCHASLADRLAQVLYGLQTRLRFEDVDLPLLKKRELVSRRYW